MLNFTNGTQKWLTVCCSPMRQQTDNRYKHNTLLFPSPNALELRGRGWWCAQPSRRPRVILGSKQLLQLHNPSTILGMKFFKRLLNSCTATHSPHLIRCDALPAAALSPRPRRLTLRQLPPHQRHAFECRRWLCSIGFERISF
jgi:hypothetical protein